jgi:hypothetical protein
MAWARYRAPLVIITTRVIDDPLFCIMMDHCSNHEFGQSPAVSFCVPLWRCEMIWIRQSLCDPSMRSFSGFAIFFPINKLNKFLVCGYCSIHDNMLHTHTHTNTHDQKTTTTKAKRRSKKNHRGFFFYNGSIFLLLLPNQPSSFISRVQNIV